VFVLLDGAEREMERRGIVVEVVEVEDVVVVLEVVVVM
jgi:hypothetical protein